MNNQRNNLPAGRQENRRDVERRLLPFVIEFVKFSTAFAVIVAAALLTLHVATAAM